MPVPGPPTAPAHRSTGPDRADGAAAPGPDRPRQLVAGFAVAIAGSLAAFVFMALGSPPDALGSAEASSTGEGALQDAAVEVPAGSSGTTTGLPEPAPTVPSLPTPSLPPSAPS